MTRDMRKYNCFIIGQMSENYCNGEQLEIPFNAKIAYYRMPNNVLKELRTKTTLGSIAKSPKH